MSDDRLIEDPKDWSPQYCCDEAFVPASPETVFDALLDIGRWNDWWETMRFAYAGTGPMRTGDRVTFDGAVIKWTVEVVSIDRPRAIRFRYVEGALVGDTEWRVTPAPGGCRAAYIYHGVCACEDRAASTFGRFGTELHSMVMQADALDGLARLTTGQRLDAAWRQSVRDKVAAGRAALVLLREQA
ncbi:SRPBCC family protein [Sphingomonas bacterium]|uniref:SRPBCC family protein n=1 Tax=Sphingomonas bacterium TaxID=1895847 RepID=UPI001576FD54|nr:SRPBCC family protein [Sphingomonas bacterium]